jgi:hypothetical protein
MPKLYNAMIDKRPLVIARYADVASDTARAAGTVHRCFTGNLRSLQVLGRFLS